MWKFQTELISAKNMKILLMKSISKQPGQKRNQGLVAHLSSFKISPRTDILKLVVLIAEKPEVC